MINRIRQKKGVSEKTMDLAFRQYMDDKDVQVRERPRKAALT